MNPEQAKFCMNCGERLVLSNPAEVGKARTLESNLDRYLPREFELVEQALRLTEKEQPSFRALPLAFLVRLDLLNDDLETAQKLAGAKPLEPITIPYSRYTISVCLANIELALAKGEYERALLLAEELFEGVSPLTQVDLPDVLRRKAEALVGLSRLEEAYQILPEAHARAKKLGSRHHLWTILSDLADVNRKLGRDEEAEIIQEESRKVIDEIAESLSEVGLRDMFLNQPRVQRVMRG